MVSVGLQNDGNYTNELTRQVPNIDTAPTGEPSLTGLFKQLPIFQCFKLQKYVYKNHLFGIYNLFFLQKYNCK